MITEQLLPSREMLPAYLVNQTDQSVGIRIPRHPVALKLLELSAVPITATSANKHMSPTTYSADEIKNSFGEDFSKIDYVLDAGDLPRTAPSTLVSLMGKEPKILREGPIGLAEGLAVLA